MIINRGSCGDVVDTETRFSITDQALHQVMTKPTSFIKTDSNGFINENQIPSIIKNPDFDRNNGRVQLMNNYDLQFTDDIKAIIQGVLNYRRSFNEAKSIYKMQQDNSYFFSSQHEKVQLDPRSGRPINVLVANNEIVKVPRKLRDSFAGDEKQSALESTRNGILQHMNQKDYDNSGFEEIAKKFNPDSVYTVSQRDDVIDSMFEKTTKMSKKLV